MASEKPGSIEQDIRRFPPARFYHLGIVGRRTPKRAETEQDLQEFRDSLLSMENLDRASPDLWQEKVPGVTEFINSFQTTPQSATKLPYSRELTHEDQDYLHQLAALSTGGLIGKVKELHDIAYQLGVEESKEVTRGKYLNLFNRNRKNP